jgi:hypothetical protein
MLVFVTSNLPHEVEAAHVGGGAGNDGGAVPAGEAEAPGSEASIPWYVYLCELMLASTANFVSQVS